MPAGLFDPVGDLDQGAERRDACRVSKEQRRQVPLRQTTPRLALSKAEAAEALGISVDFLEDHVLAELRVVRLGRRRLIPVAELERWLAEHSERAIPGP